MSTPTNIPETPMGETEQDSFFQSKEKFQHQLQDIFQTTLKLTRPDQFDQLCQCIPLIMLQTDSLATGQTGDDIFNLTPINPDLVDPEKLTSESIHSFLTLVVQLQWLVDLGRIVTHAQVTTLSKLKLTQKKLQRTYGYILQINESFLTQSKYYFHETLTKHWEPFKFLKMVTKLLMTYGGIVLISRPTFMDISISSK